MDAAGWRRTVLSTQGPELAGTRIVLVAISVEMEKAGALKVRLPLIALTRATGLARPTVIRHLREAVGLRWLRRQHPRGFGQAWATYEYEPAVPWSVRFHEEQRGKGAEARA